MIKTFDRIQSVYLNFVIAVFLTGILFFCTTNRIVGFPLDKLMMFLLFSLLLALEPRKPIFKETEICIIAILFIIATLSSVANSHFVPMIFFPVIGILFSVILSKYGTLIKAILYYAIFIHTLFAIFFVFSAYMFGPGDHVWPLIDKGLPFVFAARGFTPTVQTYGTLCILWALIFFHKKENGDISKIDKLSFIINMLAILLTLNRSTYLFISLILFFKMRKLFWLIILMLVGILIRFWQQIFTFLTSKASVESRSELLQGFNLSFWGSGSFLVYIFGKGNNELPPEIVSQVKWDHRSDIENGYAMILHTYGFLGLFFYVSICLIFVWKFIKIKRYGDVFIILYFLFVSPYITQEFVSSTFYLFLATILYIYYSLYTERSNNDWIHNQVK